MTKHNLVIREVDRQIFDQIKSGKKDVETRAAIEKYQKVRAGDVLVFVCGQDRLERKVTRVSHFKDIDSLVSQYDLERIMPAAATLEKAKAIWYSFPNYKAKIKQFGLIAFELK